MKIKIVAPDFESEHLNFEKSFQLMGLDFKTYLYNESDYIKNISFIRKFFLFTFKKLLPTEYYKNKRYNQDKFMEFIEEIEADLSREDILFIIKPYLYRDSEKKRKVKKVIFFHYDTMKRFPIQKILLESNYYENFTFDIKDAVFYKINYSPIPRSFQNAETIDNSKYIYFYGSFSFYRLTRLIVARYAFKKTGLRTCFYLRNTRLTKNWKIFGIYIGPEYRSFNGKGIKIDIPQNNQNGGSFRSTNSESLVLSYSDITPHWRHLSTNSMIKLTFDCIRIGNLIKNNYYIYLFLEEKNKTHLIFKNQIIDKIFKNNSPISNATA